MNVSSVCTQIYAHYQILPRKYKVVAWVITPFISLIAHASCRYYQARRSVRKLSEELKDFPEAQKACETALTILGSLKPLFILVACYSWVSYWIEFRGYVGSVQPWNPAIRLLYHAMHTDLRRSEIQWGHAGVPFDEPQFSTACDEHLNVAYVVGLLTLKELPHLLQYDINRLRLPQTTSIGDLIESDTTYAYGTFFVWEKYEYILDIQEERQRQNISTEPSKHEWKLLCNDYIKRAQQLVPQNVKYKSYIEFPTWLLNCRRYLSHPRRIPDEIE